MVKKFHCGQKYNYRGDEAGAWRLLHTRAKLRGLENYRKYYFILDDLFMKEVVLLINTENT